MEKVGLALKTFEVLLTKFVGLDKVMTVSMREEYIKICIRAQEELQVKESIYVGALEKVSKYGVIPSSESHLQRISRLKSIADKALLLTKVKG